jgi:uncharacterized protein (TIGR02001 family)
MLESSRNAKTVSRSHFLTPALALSWLAGTLGSAAGAAADFGSFSLGGSLALTSDYIYRGLSESNDHLAPQVDLHVDDSSGDFLGVWSSTRDQHFDPYANYDLELYLGHHFDFNGSWGATLSGRSHYYLGGSQETSADYQELAATVTYLDRWSLSLTAIPNAVRYWYGYRLSRNPAYVADSSLQWLIGSGWFVTGGAGYYYVTGTGPGIESSGGYLYGNAGVAFEFRGWRFDLGYFLTQNHARELFPYPIANEHFAGTVAWRF